MKWFARHCGVRFAEGLPDVVIDLQASLIVLTCLNVEAKEHTMGSIISLSAYKAEKGIVPPRSPYLTTNATTEQISAAAKRARVHFSQPFDFRGVPPFAVVIGYEDKKGRVRLLKDQIIFPSRSSLEAMGGMATMKTVAVVRENGL